MDMLRGDICSSRAQLAGDHMCSNTYMGQGSVNVNELAPNSIFLTFPCFPNPNAKVLLFTFMHGL